MTGRESPPPRYRWYDVPEGTQSLAIEWERFSSFGQAAARFRDGSCLYTLQTADRSSLYVGKANGLRRRYASASGALDAALGNSTALVFVAAVESSLLDFLEHTIIFWDCPQYNARGIHTRPWPHVPLLHQFDGVSSWWGSGPARETGGIYEGPLFCSPGQVRAADTGVMV